MRLLTAFSLLVIFLSACDGAPGDYSDPSPYRQKAIADAEIQETAAAQVERQAQATLAAARDAGETENEIARIMAPVRARESEVTLESTAVANRAAAATLSAAETAQAIEYDAARLAAEQRRIEAQIEIDRRRRLEANAAAWDSVWRWAKPLLSLAIGGAFAALLYFLPRRWLEHVIRQKRQAGSILLLSDGTKIFFDERGQPDILDLDLPRARFGLPKSSSPAGGNGNGSHEPDKLKTLSGVWGSGESVQAVGASGNVLVSPLRAPDHSTNGLALELVQESMRKLEGGAYKDELAGWRALNWPSSRWQRAVGALKAAGLVETVEGQGTYLPEGGRYDCLAQLEMALRSRELVLRPAPPPPYPVAGD